MAYIVGWAFVQWGRENTGWRWMVGLGALPAGVQCLVMLVMPETPRWLVKVGRGDEARSVLNKVFGKGVDIQRMVDGVLQGIVSEVREEENAKRGRLRGQTKKGSNSWLAASKDDWAELFRTGGNRRALTIACLLQGLQQLCGFVSISLYPAEYSPNLNNIELLNVFLGHHLHHPRVLQSNIDIALRRFDKFPYDLRGAAPHRSRWQKTYTPLVYSNHGRRFTSLQRWVYFHPITGGPQFGEPFFVGHSL